MTFTRCGVCTQDLEHEAYCVKCHSRLRKRIQELEAQVKGLLAVTHQPQGTVHRLHDHVRKITGTPDDNGPKGIA